jgi:NitT/TauT family transport system substrate-binding protein
MTPHLAQGWTRREFLKASATVGSSAWLGSLSASAQAEPPPETRTIRIIGDPGAPVLCYAPQFVAEELLRAEEFDDVRYVKYQEGGEPGTLGAGHADISGVAANDVILAIDAGIPILALAGQHGGCSRLFGSDRVHTLRDLRGKTVGVDGLGFGDHTFLLAALQYIGIDAQREVNFVDQRPHESMQQLPDGKIDAFMTYPPFVAEAEAKRIGRVVLNTTVDRPWSEYYCCITTFRREFVERYPVATKRALRALIKASELCSLEPERSTRLLQEKGYAPDYGYALETLREIPYGRWREYDPASTLNFYAIRQYDAGMIRSTPQKIIARGTDWRFLNQLKRELKV